VTAADQSRTSVEATSPLPRFSTSASFSAVFCVVGAGLVVLAWQVAEHSAKYSRMRDSVTGIAALAVVASVVGLVTSLAASIVNLRRRRLADRPRGAWLSYLCVPFSLLAVLAACTAVVGSLMYAGD
jgi:hypothetical protein